MNRVAVNPALLVWARRRASTELSDLAKRFPKLEAWEEGQEKPTLRQLEEFARAVCVPIGYLFLPEPPVESLPVPDLRTPADRPVAQPSPNLLDTLYLCQQRQDWFREYALVYGLERIDFVGTASTEQDPVQTADRMRQTLGLSVAEREKLPTWTDALRQLAEKAENAGVLVMASSIVGNNTHRKLDVNEFRGFALADDLAPLVFINTADSKSAQMFTLAHELAHLWLGESGVSDIQAGQVPSHDVERWANLCAAELLVPLADFKEDFRRQELLTNEIQRLARHYKVSTLVVLRRAFDAGFIGEDKLWEEYQQELNRIRSLDRTGAGGGDFYRTLGVRTGKRFAEAVLISALEGYTLYREAMRMLGIRKMSTFHEAARKLGVMA